MSVPLRPILAVVVAAAAAALVRRRCGVV